jgi:hypothetical protein
MTNRIIPIDIAVNAKYTAGQKSPGDPNHIRGVRMMAIIGTSMQNVRLIGKDNSPKIDSNISEIIEI